MDVDAILLGVFFLTFDVAGNFLLGSGMNFTRPLAKADCYQVQGLRSASLRDATRTLVPKAIAFDPALDRQDSSDEVE